MIMSFKTNLFNFLSGAIGSGVTYREVAPVIENNPPIADNNAIITAVVTLVGGIVSTVLTNLLKRLFEKPKNDTVSE